MDEWNKSDVEGKDRYALLNGKFRLGISQFGGSEEESKAAHEAKIDLDKIGAGKGRSGNLYRRYHAAMDK